MNRIQVLILFLVAVGCLTACVIEIPPASTMASPSESVSQMQAEAPLWEHSAAQQEDQPVEKGAVPHQTQGGTVLTGIPDPKSQQVFYLWEEENVPAVTEYTANDGGYFDDPGFRPTITTFPVPEGVPVKGAVLVCAGGAFQYRSGSIELYKVIYLGVSQLLGNHACCGIYLSGAV